MFYGPNRHFPPPRPNRGGDNPDTPTAIETVAEQIHANVLTTRTKLCHGHDYPEQRDRPRGASPSTGEKYERYEAVTGAAGTGGAFADLGAFSGTPDAIDLVATGGDALVSLRDNTGREESALRLIAGVPLETHISRRRVFAVNVADGNQATVRATGKWADLYTPDAES